MPMGERDPKGILFDRRYQDFFQNYKPATKPSRKSYSPARPELPLRPSHQYYSPENEVSVKKVAMVVLALSLLASLSIGPAADSAFSTTHAQELGATLQGEPSFVPGRILVGFRAGVASRQVDNLLAAGGVRSVQEDFSD